MRTRRIFLTIALLVILAGCLSLFMLVSEFSDGAVSAALRESNTPDSAQKVTAVCLGLNIGSCRVAQDSASARAAGAVSGNPWPVIALATAVIAPLVLGVMVLGRED